MAASVLGAGWIVSRILYAVGYTRADKEAGKGRLIGLPFWLFQLGLYGLVGYTGVKNILWGPYFGTVIQGVFNTAQGA